MLLCNAERCGRAFLHGRSGYGCGASVVMMMMLMAGADAGNHGDDSSAGQKKSKRVAVATEGCRLTGIAGIGKKPEEAETGEEEQEHRPEAESGRRVAEQDGTADAGVESDAGVATGPA